MAIAPVVCSCSMRLATREAWASMDEMLYLQTKGRTCLLNSKMASKLGLVALPCLNPAGALMRMAWQA